MSYASWTFAGALALALANGGSAFAQSTPKGGDPEAAKIQNPVAQTPESIDKGKAVFMKRCVMCHGPKADGTAQIVIEGGVSPANLTEPTYIYGTADGQIFTNIKNGILPNLNMPTWDEIIPDADIWNVVNFLRTVRQKG